MKNDGNHCNHDEDVGEGAADVDHEEPRQLQHQHNNGGRDQHPDA
jgi:hypothetical protein